jgi:hypothetical protein
LLLNRNPEQTYSPPNADDVFEILKEGCISSRHFYGKQEAIFAVLTHVSDRLTTPQSSTGMNLIAWNAENIGQILKESLDTTKGCGAEKK